MLPRRRTALAASLAALLAVQATGAHAILILDSTWREEGGGKGHESEGFDAHYALAHEPQFDALVALYEEGEHVASGTWIGNDGRRGYILTASHVFDGGSTESRWTVRTETGGEYRVVDHWMHPRYDEFDDRTLGFDMAIMVVERPIEDLGPEPTLYCGVAELGQVATFVGYGYVGTGSYGEEMRFQLGIERAAARNRIEIVAPLTDPDDANSLIVDFDSERGDDNALADIGSDPYPIDRLEGALGSGDSGGSIWIQQNGGWMLAGINSAGGRGYGGLDWFARIATQHELLRGVFPGAHFGGGANGGCGGAKETGFGGKPTVPSVVKP